jgi:hypothetical protein
MKLQSTAGLLAGLALLFSAVVAPGQGTFQNLNFESANIPGGTQAASMVPMSSALPGWSGYLSSTNGISPWTQAVYDGVSLGGPGICLIDQKQGQLKPLQGIYSLLLYGGNTPTNFGGPTSATITQTGMVPIGTRYLLMDVAANGNGGFTVSLAGQRINMEVLQFLPSYWQLGGDISAFAGQPAQLPEQYPRPHPASLL